VITRRSLLYSGLCAAAISPPLIRSFAAAEQFDPNRRQPPWRHDVASSQTISAGSSKIQIDFAAGDLKLSPDKIAQIVHWVTRASQAVTAYFGRFPVPVYRIMVIPSSGGGIHGGTTWGNVGGSPAFTRVSIGEDTTVDDFNTDWIMTHEMIHTALPSLPDDNHWFEEGTAVYIEPIARVQAGQMRPDHVWIDMVKNMPQGQPHDGDQGLDRTHGWGRTYWGGAGFCLHADVEIRKATHNRQSLQTALRGVTASGHNISKDEDILPVLAVADKATGTQTLTTLYKKMSDNPVSVDFDDLWHQLGVTVVKDTVTFDPKAPLAYIRESIFAPLS
jgi:hypothetical protein